MNNVMIAVVMLGLLSMSACGGSEKPAEPASESSPATQPTRIVGLEAGWELANQADYAAVQKEGEVVITAKGDAPTSGYKVKLVMSPLRIYPPQWMLAWKKPDGPALQVITPFEVTASFKAAEPVGAVKVSDAAGHHEVSVAKP